MKLRLWWLLAQHFLEWLRSLPVVLSVRRLEPAAYGLSRRQDWVLQATGVPKYYKYTCYKCKRAMQPISSNASRQGPLSETARKIGIRFGTSRNPSHGPKSKKESKKMSIFWIVWFVAISWLSPPHETALAITLTFCDLQVGDPNPHQVTPADLQRDEGVPTEDEVRSLIRLLVASERIEASLFSCWKTPREGFLAVFECVGTQVWSLDFLGKYTIAVTPFTQKIQGIQRYHMQLSQPLQPASWPL